METPTTRTDRAAEARAEAERRFPDLAHVMRGQDRIIFTQGVVWADANPKPHTITRAEIDEAATRFAEVGESGDWVSLEDMLTAALSTLGIEVEDDDE